MNPRARRLGSSATRAGPSPFGAMALAGPRVTLRSLKRADAPAFFAIFSDPVVMRYWSRSPFAAVAEADAQLRDIRAGYRSGQALQLGVERNRDRALIGTCTLFHFVRGSRRAEIGYALASAHWGQGYMHDALQTLLAFAFDELELNRLEADIDPRNAASARTLDRLGFVREGQLRERWVVGDEISDTDLYGLLRREWRRPVADAPRPVPGEAVMKRTRPR